MSSLHIYRFSTLLNDLAHYAETSARVSATHSAGTAYTDFASIASNLLTSIPNASKTLDALEKQSQDFFTFITSQQQFRDLGDTRWLTDINILLRTSFFQSYKLTSTDSLASLTTISRHGIQSPDDTTNRKYYKIFMSDMDEIVSPVTVFVPPCCLEGKHAYASETNMAAILGIENGTWVYYTRDAVYVVHRVGQVFDGRIAINLPDALSNLCVSGATVSLVSSIEGQTIGNAVGQACLNSLTHVNMNFGNQIMVIDPRKRRTYNIHLSNIINIDPAQGVAYPNNARTVGVRIKGDFYLDPNIQGVAMNYEYHVPNGQVSNIWDRDLTELIIPAIHALRRSGNNSYLRVNNSITGSIRAAMNGELNGWGTAWQIAGDIETPETLLTSIWLSNMQGEEVPLEFRSRVMQLASYLLAMVSMFLRYYRGNVRR